LRTHEGPSGIAVDFCLIYGVEPISATTNIGDSERRFRATD
jgi:hypothetical protein